MQNHVVARGSFDGQAHFELSRTSDGSTWMCGCSTDVDVGVGATFDAIIYDRDLRVSVYSSLTLSLA